MPVGVAATQVGLAMLETERPRAVLAISWLPTFVKAMVFKLFKPSLRGVQVFPVSAEA